MKVLDEIHRARLAGVRAGTWPAHSVAMWRELAEAAAARYRAGHSPTPIERRALEVFPDLVDQAAAA